MTLKDKQKNMKWHVANRKHKACVECTNRRLLKFAAAILCHMTFLHGVNLVFMASQNDKIANG